MKYLMLIIVFLIGCSKTEQPIVNNTYKLEWKKDIMNGKMTGSMRPVIYEDFVIYSRGFMESEDHAIIAYNKKNGKKEWVWNDYFDEYDRGLGPRRANYIYNNVLVVTTGRDVYAIDVENGQTLWKTREDYDGRVVISGLDNTIFHVKYVLDETQSYVAYEYIAKADIYTGKWEEIVRINNTIGNNLNLNVKHPQVHINNQGDTILAFGYGTWHFTLQEGHGYVSFYNTTTKELVVKEYEDINTVSNYIYDGKYYTGGGTLRCFDLDTYELLWDTPTPNGAGFPIVRDGVMFFNSEGLTPSIHAINPNTGQILWKTLTNGSGSLLDYKDGVIFYAGGGFMRAIQASDGQVLWKAESPDYAANSDAFFEDIVTIDPETNKLYTGNYFNALCYQLE